MLSAELGLGSLPVIKLKDAKGNSAEIYSHGAHLTRYSTGGKDVIFVSKKAIFQPPKAIRGGVPVCLPQFAKLGPLQQHGFARNTAWDLVSGTGADGAEFQLDVTPELQQTYDYSGNFTATVKVSLTAQGHLKQDLEVTNTADSDMEMTTALHTYFRVSDAAQAKVVGLKGCTYYDSVQNGAQCKEEGDAVTFPGEVDRVYMGVPRTIKLEDPGNSHIVVLQLEGFPDAVVWNPGAEKTAAMSDMEPEEYKEFVCIEAALARSGPVKIAAGDTWTGSQTISVVPL